jgi:MFS family permease
MDSAIPDSAHRAAAEPAWPPHSPRYLWALLAMLLSATIFEGYDITIFHLCTPDIARTFHMGDAAVGAMATTVRFGGILSFFVVTMAGYYGRKRVLANTVLAYGFFTLLSGYLLDRMGRRATTTIFFVGTGATMATLFHSADHRLILFAFMATMFAYQGARTATSALSAELFPTSARATGYGLTVQVLGQMGLTLAPLLAGLLARPLGGLANASALFAAGPIIGALLVMLYVPETRGKTLEELAPGSGARASRGTGTDAVLALAGRILYLLHTY